LRSIADNLLPDRLCDPASPWRVPPAARRQTAAPRLGALALFSATVLLGQTTQAEPLKGAPAPFNKGGVKMALSNYLSTGDFFQA
jgi:hypothetical protein